MERAELTKKKAASGCSQPYFKIDSKSGVLVLSGMSLFPQRHNYDLVVAHNIFAAKSFPSKLQRTSSTQV